MDAILCSKVHVPYINLKIYDKNYYDTDRVDKLFIQTEKCCYRSHYGLDNITSYWMCGRDAIFSNIPNHECVKTYEYTSKEATHDICACPDEYDHDRKFVWMDFIKVVRTEGDKANKEDEE